MNFLLSLRVISTRENDAQDVSSCHQNIVLMFMSRSHQTLGVVVHFAFQTH